MNQGEVATFMSIMLDRAIQLVSIPYESGRSGHLSEGEEVITVNIVYQSLMNQGEVATSININWR